MITASDRRMPSPIDVPPSGVILVGSCAISPLRSSVGGTIRRTLSANVTTATR